MTQLGRAIRRRLPDAVCFTADAFTDGRAVGARTLWSAARDERWHVVRRRPDAVRMPRRPIEVPLPADAVQRAHHRGSAP